MASEDRTTTRIFEEAANSRARQEFVLTLFVAGMTSRSLRAIENARRLCEEHLKGRYHLEVIDIYQHPETAKDSQVIAAPTLVKQLPPPLQRFIGDLSDSGSILVRLSLNEEMKES